MLKLQDVKKNYPGFSLNCSLELKPGQITGLIGQNGAGKTTLFKSILRLIRIDGGTIDLLGKDIKNITEDDMTGLGCVLADSGFSGYLTVSDIQKILKSFYPDFKENWFIQKSNQFGLPQDKQIKDFSTGMKAKLKVLSALSHNSKLLIMDEPTSGLDVVAREEVLTLLREYMEEDENRSILISSHISSDLETLCDDFYMIHNGEIILHEDTDNLLANYAILKVNEKEYADLDKTYLIRASQEPFGYSCLTNQRAFYQENYPEIVIEKSGIDEVIMHIIKGEKI